MSTETKELIRICESLPEDKRSEVIDFARFLAARLDDESDIRAIQKSQSEKGKRVSYRDLRGKLVT